MRCMLKVGVLVLALLTPSSWEKRPAQAQQSWSGFYAGGAVGQRTLNVLWETTCLQIGFPGAQCPDASGFFADRYRANNPVDWSSTAFAFAGFAGWQWQLGLLVLGVEGDFTATKNGRTINAIPGAEDPTLTLDQSPDTVTVKAEWDAAVRGRVGLLVLPNVLAYGTAGPAWMRVGASVYCGAEFPAGWCSLENVGRVESISQTLRGWTWGGGVEAMLGSGILLRGEYRIARYGATGHTYFDGLLNNADAFSARTTFDTRTILLGLGYKF